MLKVEIDNGAQDPIYRQISAQIAEQIRSGCVAPGKKLPTERELAQRLKVARGTVKKAYESLARQHYIIVAGRRGSLVASSLPDIINPAIPSSDYSFETQSDHNVSMAANSTCRLGRASNLILKLIQELERLSFNWREMAELFSLLLAKREEDVSRFAIAAIDCNPEALGIYQSQLALLTHMSMARILFADLNAADDPAAMLEPFDLILTTSTHIDELRSSVPSITDKAVPVVVSPSQSTLIALAKLDNEKRVGILHKSMRFFQIICVWAGKSGFNGHLTGCCYCDENQDALEAFVEDKDVLIVPPGFSAQLSPDLLHVINRFRQRGAQVIDFEYQIERGSLLYLEELIKKMLNKSGKAL